VLKQEAHLLSDFTHQIEGQAGDPFAMDVNLPRLRPFKADDEPQQHALSRTAASRHGQVSPRLTRRVIPFRTFWLPKDLCTFSMATTDALSLCSGFACFVAMS
jgi:hypothetical protein